MTLEKRGESVKRWDVDSRQSISSGKLKFKVRVNNENWKYTNKDLIKKIIKIVTDAAKEMNKVAEVA